MTGFTQPAAAATPGGITSPTVGGLVSGSLQLTASYATDYAGVQWAVREGTCASGTNTRDGNVDGHQTPYTWEDGEFSATVDVSGYSLGSYCFVLNPIEGLGQAPVRDSVEFTIVAPTLSSKDQCMDGGWQLWGDLYKNQGQCIADAESSEKSKHHRG